MKKIAAILLVVLNLTFFPSSVSAQNKPLACQVDKAAGLIWERGRWATTSFVAKKFILVQTGFTLTEESVAKAFSEVSLSMGASCSTVLSELVSCRNDLGTSLFFDFKTLKGAIAKTFGSTMTTTDYKDTVSVEVFSCTPY